MHKHIGKAQRIGEMTDSLDENLTQRTAARDCLPDGL